MDPDDRVHVSGLRREEFKNGLGYDHFDGLPLSNVPRPPAERPAEALLRWHNETAVEAGTVGATKATPFCWPCELRHAPSTLWAGAPPTTTHPFERESDRSVYRTYGKKPHSVGADRIAREVEGWIWVRDPGRGSNSRAQSGDTGPSRPPPRTL